MLPRSSPLTILWKVVKEGISQGFLMVTNDVIGLSSEPNQSTRSRAG